LKKTKQSAGRKPLLKMLNLGEHLNTWLNKYRLGTQLNISFALVMLVPMIIATLFSIIYYSNKIEEEAVNKISSDANMAKLIYQHAQSEMESLADSYAKRGEIQVLTKLILAKDEFDKNMARKLGTNLAKLAPADDLDMITMVDKNRRVFTRSHSPNQIGDVCQPKPYFEKVFEGETFYGVESLTVEELKRELEGGEGNRHLNNLKKFFSESQNILALTGIAPVYDKKDQVKVKGALIARRLLSPQSQFVSEACKRLETNAALFEYNRLVASCTTDPDNSEFVKPPEEVLNTVLQTNTEQHIADISRGGSISKLFPLRNFDGTPVGAFMVQGSVNSYLRTRNIAIITSLCIFLVGVLLAYSVKKIIERRIVEPLNELKIGTELIADGEYSQTLEVSSNDEIGELTQAFNNMSQDLEEYDQEVKANKAQLETRVKERTADLKKSMDNLEDTLESLNPGVSKLIESKNHKLGLVYATELVVDICTYTSLNMTLGEDMMGKFMTTFFEESHKLLAKYRGVFDKTVGDQIVAIFGIPKDNVKASHHHAFDAVECARKLVEVAQGINQTMHATIQENYTAMIERHKSLSSEDRKKIKLDELKFRCRIGINTSSSNLNSDREIDKMRMVMMGAETKTDYTAQGGSIIYAFRLESGGTPGEIGIGENTKRRVENVYQLRELGKVTLKGLGEQNEYRVVGRQPITDNIYPKTMFYRKFHENIPPVLTMLMEKIKMGAIRLKEVRKLSESLDVDIAYLEHITGIHNLTGARSLFAYAVGLLHGMNEVRLNAILLASLLRNAAMLRNIAAEFLNFVSVDVYVPPNSVDTKLAKEITDDLNQPRPSMIEAKIINMCNYFDHNAFDRTNLRNREAEVASTKIVIEAMLDDRHFDSKLVNLLKTLIMEEENYLEDSGVSDDYIMSCELTNDPLKLADQIKKRFSERAKDELFAALSVRQISEMASLNEDEIVADIAALPEQQDADMPDAMPDTIDLDAKAFGENDIIEALAADRGEAELPDAIFDKRAIIDTSPLNEKDNDIIEKTVPYDDEETDTFDSDIDHEEELGVLDKDDDAVEESVPYYYDDEEADTLDADIDHEELNDAQSASLSRVEIFVDGDMDNEELNDVPLLMLNRDGDDTTKEHGRYYDDQEPGTLDADIDHEEELSVLDKDDDTVKERGPYYDDQKTDALDADIDPEEKLSDVPLSDKDNDTLEESVPYYYDDKEPDTLDADIDHQKDLSDVSLSDKDDDTIEKPVIYDDEDAADADLDEIELSDAVSANEKDIFDDYDSATQSDTDALYEELRKMKADDMLKIEKDDKSDAS
jgi:class 3 adenylate cyclase